jgi:hypothetical protein
MNTPRELGRRLAELVMSELDGVDFTVWYADSLSLQKWIRSDSEFCNQVPNFVWSWLSDGDVRRKDPLIAAKDTEEIRKIIENLARGDMSD